MKCQQFSFLSFFLLAILSLSFSQTAHAQSSDIYQFANQCYQISTSHSEESTHYLSQTTEGYQFSASDQNIAHFYMRPAALGIYLLYDQDANYFSANEQALVAVNKLESEMTLDMPEKDYLVTAAEWELHPGHEENSYLLKHIKTNRWLAGNELNSDKHLASLIQFQSSENCRTFPESDTGASGTIQKTKHEDGTLWGFIDAHEHMGANHGFGAKAFHGAGFHKLGIEHALANSEKHHGVDGSKDLMAVIYQAGSGDVTPGAFASKIFNHIVLDEAAHSTEGYPELTNWSVHEAATLQSLYYKWIERAYLGGMRMMVEYMESTEVVCEIFKKHFNSPATVENCNEMDHVDHQIKKMRELQDYVDAQNGGPGKGWLRLVYSPEEAREVIAQGKLAVILGIEIENPLDCFLDEREGFEPCTESMVRERLNTYYDKGVRALFPSHKFVNAFSPGDGDAGILEVGDYLNSGQWRDYTDCKNLTGEYSMYSHGEKEERSLFSGLASIPGIHTLNNWLSGDDAGTPRQVIPLYPEAKAHCQQDGFTPLGLALIDEMMELGMIIDLGHTPSSALNHLMPVLVENNYPAVHTHGGDQNAINKIKGLSTRGLGHVCRDDNGHSQIQETFREILAQVDEDSGLPRKGLSYDFNGFAGYAKPRFGELSVCKTEQSDPLEYPFTSFSGDITFEKLQTGNKVYDFNTLGLANIGLLPDLIEEARRSGVKAEEIEALFKTAEAYIELWERAEAAR